MTMTSADDLAKRLTDSLRRWNEDRPKGPAPAVACAICDGTKWVPVEGTNSVQRCPECLTRARGQAPGVPVAEHGSTLATFTTNHDNQDAVHHAKLFLQDVHPDLYLFGGIGTGKTRLACCLLNDLHAKFTQVEFIRVPILLAALLPGADDIDDQIARLAKIPVIVLDDVGASQASDFARRMLLVIYEARGDIGTRTIWTSNLDLGELADFAGDDRLPSRISGRAKVAELRGKDWRLRKRS